MRKPDPQLISSIHHERRIMIRRPSSLGSLVILAFLSLLSFVASASAQEAPGAADVGVAVHGAWTVTVVRDGRVVERRSFQNDLMPQGRALLSRLLSRRNAAGPWIILVEADGSGTLCADNEFAIGEDTDCAISESTQEASVRITGEGSGTAALVIEGTETVVRDADITLVGTWQWVCDAQSAASACQASTPDSQTLFQFTRKSLDTPITVLAGDRIEVTVEISFN